MKRWIIVTFWYLLLTVCALSDFSSTGRAYYCYLAVFAAFTLGIAPMVLPLEQPSVVEKMLKNTPWI